MILSKLTPEEQQNIGLCPEINSVELRMILNRGATPGDIQEFFKFKGYGTWLILFVLASEDPIQVEINELMQNSYKVFKEYCQSHLEQERPVCMNNVHGKQDLYPVIAILGNELQAAQKITAVCAEQKITSFPFILAVDSGVPVRQHIGEVTIQSIRELLDRIPASGTKPY